MGTLEQALEDLQSVETAFGDLHRRYEKTKSVVEAFKKVCMWSVVLHCVKRISVIAQNLNYYSLLQ